MDGDEYEEKLFDEVKCTSEFKIKEEVIVPEVTSDSESTLSDNEKVPNLELNECTVCCKYRSMFIILKNHECQLTSTGVCCFCEEISHWIDVFKHHKQAHQLEREDSSGDSTASDGEESEGSCRVCVKYEFMIPLLKSHVCRVCDNQKCQDCVEVIHWTACFKEHLKSHENDKNETKECAVCLKYEAKLVILEEGHLCEKKLDGKCKKCDEIFQLHDNFQKHKNTHRKEGENVGGKFDCGICLKLNSIVRNLVRKHQCRGGKSCSVCLEISYWLTCLRNHKKSESESHKGTNDRGRVLRKQNCGVCSKYELALSNLREHTCSQQKCEYCLEMSFWSQNLKRHATTHLPDKVL